MIQHSNIDRADSVAVSPAPFTYTSTLKLGSVTIPAGSFLTLKVFVSESFIMPYRFHSVRQDGKVMICDSKGSLVGYWPTFDTTEPDVEFISSVLVDMQGVLMGHIACTLQTMDLIRSVVNSSLDTVYLDPAAFVFLPQCHTAMLSGYGRSFGIQSQSSEMEYHTGDLSIAASNSCVILGSTADPVGIDLSNSKTRLDALVGADGLCNIVVNGSTYNCIGKSIIIKAGIQSNLRVAMENNQIMLRGVLNA